MKQADEKLKELVSDKRLLPEQAELIQQWVKHLSTYKTDPQILDSAYPIREYALYIKKGFEKAEIGDIRGYLQIKIDSKESITGNRVSKIERTSIEKYRYKINSFYKWILKHTDLKIEQELAYPQPKIIKKTEVSFEKRCERRINALLNNEIICINRKTDGHLSKEQLQQKYSHLILDERNIELLRNFKNYKITSGKVESCRGFISKLYFLKRLGLHLKNKEKVYKEATREDIQGFLGEVRDGIKKKKGEESNEKIKFSISYKAYLLDFYRFVYGMFGEEQPRVYPDVVSWLYQGRKKSHDCIPKEIIPIKEIQQMIDKGTEQRDKALIALLADCSARVSELTNTNIKDIKINEIAADGAKYKHTIAIITLRGKTGERTNQLFSSVSYLRLWLLNHPRKNEPDAPLFIATKESRYGQRLGPVGVNKILQRTARKAGINRHIHAHLFRHTNLTRMAKILSESELKIHAGWGKESNMASVYVHLSQQDVADKILISYGLIPKKEMQEESVLKIQICPNTICNYENPGEAKFCLKCGYPLTLETAVSLNKIKEQEAELQDAILKKGIIGTDISQAKDIRDVMYTILKNDPVLIEKLKKIMEMIK